TPVIGSSAVKLSPASNAVTVGLSSWSDAITPTLKVADCCPPAIESSRGICKRALLACNVIVLASSGAASLNTTEQVKVVDVFEVGEQLTFVIRFPPGWSLMEV